MAADPSHNVHPDLLPHVHLISAYRYPLVPRFGIPEVTEWLLNAPRIARDGAPFFWTFLDTPQDGSIILTWQPLQRLGTEFSTDGYIWPRGEMYYQHEIRDGLILEVFHQPVGYRPGEEYATHSRRRFRLMPPKTPNPNIPQVDPSLWLVHYGPVDEQPIPVKKIRLEPRIRAIMDHRANLQRAGQITRKEFMLSDRVNWPHIPLPRDVRGPPMYPGAAGGHHVPQQMAYPPHAPPGALPAPPPSKRARHNTAGASSAHPPPGMVAGPPGMAGPPHMMQPMEAAIYEDEEDTSRGDMFDNITPRDVSLERYKLNHEWMEEVISSPYRISQIGYADLGLGLKGELAPVTEGIFEGQGFDAYTRTPKKPYIGRLDAGLADEFKKRAQEKIDATNREIAEMKAAHEKLVANFQLNSAIKKAEHDLRFTEEETGPEIWRIEGHLHDAANGSDSTDGHWAHEKHHKSVEDVLSQVEKSLDRKVVASGSVVRIQDGGYREPTPEPEPEPEPEPVAEVPTISTTPATGFGGDATGTGTPAGGAAAVGPGSASLSHPSPAGSQISGIMIGDADIDMDGTAAGMLDQMESAFSPASSTNFPTQPQAPTAVPNVSHLNQVSVPSPLGNAQSAAEVLPAAAKEGGAGAAASTANVSAVPGGEPLDITMEDAAGQAAGAPASASHPGAASVSAPDAGGSADDWVVVPPGGASPAAAEAPAALASIPTSAAGTAPGIPVAGGTTLDVPAVPAAAVPPSVVDALAAKSPSAATGGVVSAVPTPGGIDSNNDFGSLEDLDTAGEALASLDDGDLGDGLDLHMDMEDSAFGDAFHGAGGN